MVGNVSWSRADHEKHTMVTRHGHTIADHVQTWSAMKNRGTMVHLFPGGKNGIKKKRGREKCFFPLTPNPHSLAVFSAHFSLRLLCYPNARSRLLWR